jgi:Holliday junction DNA helicase RuvA
MIVALDGILESRGVDSAVVRVGPISLQVNMPSSVLGRLGAAGDKVRLHTYLYLREDIIALYGFAALEELGLFPLLPAVTLICSARCLA